MEKSIFIKPSRVSHNKTPSLPSNIPKVSHNKPPLSNQVSHNPPPFLSNSDGAQRVKELRQKMKRERHRTDVIKDRGETPIFLGGKYLRNNDVIKDRYRLDSNMTDVTTTPTTSLKEGESANSLFSSKYFLFPPTNQNPGNHGNHVATNHSNQDTSNHDNHDASNRSNASSGNCSNLSSGERSNQTSGSHDNQQNIRKSASYSNMNLISGKTKISERRRSSSSFVFPTPRRSLEKDSGKSEKKNKQQQNQVNQRILRRRLRVGYLTHEFVSELRMRKRRKTKNNNFRILSPLDRFRKVVFRLRIMIRVLDKYRKISIVSTANQMSFAMLSNDFSTTRRYRHGLTFDPTHYKAVSERTLNDKARDILTLLPQRRSEEQLQYALKRVRSAVEEFAEFPLQMQEALIKVAWLDEFEPKRIIIRQGHKAETFYLIVSGTALVTKNMIGSNGEGYVETVKILNRGKSFGELAIMRHEQRTNNVVSQTKLTLLTVGRNDFIDIFMNRTNNNEPEFISFLRTLPEFNNFPFYKLPTNKPKLCAFTYFRVGVVICRDSNLSDVIVIIKSGVCRVVKRLMTSQPDLPQLKNIPENLNYEEVGLERLPGLNNNRFISKTIVPSPTSSIVTSSEAMLTGARLPSIVRRMTIDQQQQFENERWSLDQSFLFPFNFNNNYNKHPGFKPHKRQILRKYNKWQEEHPISQDTFSLLMSGRKEESEKNEEEEENDEFETEEMRINSYLNPIPFYKNQQDDIRRDSLESNFRTEILRRNRTSLANAWNFKQRKKASTASTTLPTLNENILTKPPQNITTGKSLRPVYIHVQYLREKDVFGLLPILFTPQEGSTSVSLVSEGSECVLINKELFLKHFDDEQRERLVRMITPYPTETSLQTKMLEQSNWDAFKFMTVHSHVINKSRDK